MEGREKKHILTNSKKLQIIEIMMPAYAYVTFGFGLGKF
jgi:hypothetical protein